MTSLTRTFLLAAFGIAQCSASRLVWSDDFTGPAGTRPSARYWNIVRSAHNPNSELEIYTDDPKNVFLDGNGHLVIRAIAESNGTFTSARLNTKDKFETKYGRIEARIKIPRGQGIWPAFWMMGDTNGKDWPDCGEIDIMENIGKTEDLDKIHGTVHGPGYSGAKGPTHVLKSKDNRPWADDFHVYAVEWKPKRIEFFVDGQHYATVTPASLPPGTHWVYDHPFYLLLNVAVGGGWPGNPDQSTQFPQEMLVDWVRVYR